MWFVIGLILLVLILSAATAVAADAPSGTADTIIKRQVVQHLINTFADPACTSSEVNTQQAAFDPSQPVTGCWLVIEALSASNQTQSEGVQNER